MTSATAVAASVMTRTVGCVVSAGLSVHVNCVHAPQISQPSRIDRRMPPGVSSWAVSAVSWVTAKTKTRSKKSSTNVTACAVVARKPPLARPTTGRAYRTTQWGHVRDDDALRGYSIDYLNHGYRRGRHLEMGDPRHPCRWRGSDRWGSGPVRRAGIRRVQAGGGPAR